MKKGGFAIMGIGAMIALVSAAIKGREAASIGIIGGADGPTAIFVTGEAVGVVAGMALPIGVAILIAGIILWNMKQR